MKRTCLLGFIVSCCLSGLLQAQVVPRFELSDSAVVPLPKNQDIRFGYLVVLEDRSKPDGKTIRLPVFILQSRSANPKPDPVLYTAGGPGSSSVTTAQYGEYFSYLDDRDFIVFEQRGTRYAQPALACPELDSIKKTNNWLSRTAAQREQLEVAAALRCHNRLVAEGNDLSQYHTKASADDIEDLRKVLGIKQLNLLSISYSTKIAQVLLRDYPQSIRSAVLDSPLPLWANYDEISLDFFSEKLDLLFSSCAKDSACNDAFPNLKACFYRFLENANKKPVLVSLKSPVDSSLIQVSLQGHQIASFVNLGATWQLARLPKMLDKLCKGDYSVLHPFIYNLFASDDRAMGMRLSVWCSEEYPFENVKNVPGAKSRAAALSGVKATAVPLQICSVWKVKKAPVIENQPFTSAVPVLLLNGEFDPDTPPAWGLALQKRLPNSFHYIFKGMSHTPTQNWDNTCGMQLANAFFNAPGTKPEPGCFSTLSPLTFDTGK